MFFRDSGQFALGLMEAPLAGEDAPVFIAVAIAEHHDNVVDRTAYRDGMAQEPIENSGAVFEIANSFKQWRYGEFAGQSSIFFDQKTSFAGEQVNHQQIGDAAGHADDHWTQAIGSVSTQHTKERSYVRSFRIE